MFAIVTGLIICTAVSLVIIVEVNADYEGENI
ncbi:hypothetical protein J2S08_000071 [Bacillus chungangensis]|uniref:YtzI protein n=1 Tax=Bacillus chungangensis TaxID=587633 RepID=A0ABT9WN81_9BACI|nr:hypothetical protein [Bacillus chungangensis]